MEAAVPDDTPDPSHRDPSRGDMEALTGKGGAGESGGGAYPNPHTGKQERGEKRGFVEGGQSDNRYFGPRHATANSAKKADRDDVAADTDGDANTTAG
jgi:hypothetical protein